MPRLDYQRFGRQIALPEIGPEGQSRIACTHVSFHGDARSVAFATAIVDHAGGCVSTESAIDLTIPAHTSSSSPLAPLDQSVLAAWSALESMRRALGLAPVATPEALVVSLKGSA